MKAVVSIRSPPAACNVDARQGACRTAAPSCWRALFRQRAYDGRIMFHRRPCDRGSQDCSRQTAGGFQDSHRYQELAADHRVSHGDRAADSWPGPGWNAGAPNPDHVRPPDDRRVGGRNVRAAARAAVGRDRARARATQELYYALHADMQINLRDELERDLLDLATAQSASKLYGMSAH